MSKIAKRFRVGSKVVLSPDALENYGEKYEGRVFRVESVSTKYMPANQFFAEGKPKGYHPGYDDSSGSALYDLLSPTADFHNSVYDWELEPAPRKAHTTRYATTKKPSDPTYSAQWSGVTGAPKCAGRCSTCGGALHHEGDTHYCPSCDDFKARPTNCNRR